MNTYWILLFILFIILFAIGETYAFDHPNRENTLSHAIAEMGAKWPFSIFLVGGLVIGLGVHFYWPWCANPLGAGGG